MSGKYLTPLLWKRLNVAKLHYQEAERLTGVPWALLAAIHYRENTLASSSPNAGGPMQADPPWTRAQCAACAKECNTTITYPATSLRDAIIMCAWIIQKEKAKPHLTPTSSRAEMLNAAYRYNGTGYGDINKSPYVYSDPLNGKALPIRGTINGVAVRGNDAKGGVNAILDEIGGGAPLVSNSGNAIPAITVASSVVYYPIANWAQVSTAVGQFLDPVYRKLRNAWHPGQDCNKGNGPWADLGEPVYAIADGTVVHAGWHPISGNIVLIHHPQLGVWSNHMHFKDVLVTTGQSVNAGHQIGTIGQGDPTAAFTPHLHFEIRVADMSPGHWPGGSSAAYAEIGRNYRDPVSWLRAHNACDVPVGGVAQTEDLHPDLVRIRGAMVAWLRTNHPGLRLVTVLTYAPPLSPSLGAATSAPARLGPHNVHPALAFDYRLRRGAKGDFLGCLDQLYATLGQYAEAQGGLWGPHASPPPANEAGNLRNHIQLKNAEAALKDAQTRAAQGAIPAGSSNTAVAAQNSDPAKADEVRRQNCPAPAGN